MRESWTRREWSPINFEGIMRSTPTEELKARLNTTRDQRAEYIDIPVVLAEVMITEMNSHPVEVIRERELLTEKEREIIQKTGELWGLINDAVAEAPKSHPQDLDELLSHVHYIQRCFMANAAARAYPDDFRAFGSGVKPGKNKNAEIRIDVKEPLPFRFCEKAFGGVPHQPHQFTFTQVLNNTEESILAVCMGFVERGIDE